MLQTLCTANLGDTMSNVERNDHSLPPRPAWVKWLAIGIVIAIVLAVLAMMLLGGGHGPGRHM